MPLHARCIPVGLPLHDRCIPVGLPLHARCTPVGLPLHVRCIPVGLPLHVRCTPVGLPLHVRCIPVGLPLHDRCIPVGLPLHARCIPVGLPLHARCTPVGLPLHARCIPVGLPLHVRCIPGWPAIACPLHSSWPAIACPLHSSWPAIACPLHSSWPAVQCCAGQAISSVCDASRHAGGCWQSHLPIITRSLVPLYVQLNWCTNKLFGPILLRDATIKSPVFSSPMKSLLPSVERLIRGHGPNARGGRWAPHSLPKLLCRDCSPGAPPWPPCEHCQPSTLTARLWFALSQALWLAVTLLLH